MRHRTDHDCQPTILMKTFVNLLATLAVAVPTAAQESYWLANRASNDILRISEFGTVLGRTALGTALRSAHVAPDGKVWVVRFIQPTFDIVDPASGTITPIASTLGSPYEIAFDAQGHGWVSGGTGVQEFDAAGVLLQSFPLAQAAPLGITIDATGNKWIAHRTTPASVTRIDGAGVVTNFPLPGVTTQPTKLIADFRGLGQPSHVWVVGDGAAQLVELDTQGTLLHVYPLPASSVGSVVFDKTGDIWVGSFGNGTLLRIAADTGAVLATYTIPPNILGLAVDSLGRILATARITFSGVGPPTEVRRIDPATGVIEVPTVLQFGAFSAIGTQSAVSTPFQYSLVVAPFGDLDGDGEVNFAEVQNGTSPIDAAAGSLFRVATLGRTAIGSTPAFDVLAPAGAFWGLGFATALLPVPASVPGLAGSLVLDVTTLLSLGSGIGPTSLPIAIPNALALQGYQLVAQGLALSGAALQLRNATGLLVW